MKKEKLNILIGGPAGAGVETSGQILNLTFVRGGYCVFANGEHMSQIRGGNNFLRLRVDEKSHASHVEEIDIMVALDKHTMDEHVSEVSAGGVVIFDNDVVGLVGDFEKKFGNGAAKFINLPLKNLAEKELNSPVMANVIALGFVCGLIDLDVFVLKNTLLKIFEKKGAEIIKLNEKAAQIGFDLAQKEFAKDFSIKLPKKKSSGNMLIMGNDAACVGAIKAGCKFVGEYPMTPSSSVLHFMAKWAEEYGMVVKQTEDEIAAVNSIIGAGFAGVRALTGTSGGGFALMSEGIGLASMNEVPIVIFEVMRPGPATGMPTRTEQGDLRQVIHAGQGDPVKIVLLPGDVQECFKFGFDAFNLAEKYQVPVIVAYDKYLGESYFTTAPFDEKGMEIDRGKLLTQKQLDKIDDYKRYLRTEDGVSFRSIPGMKNGVHRATSDEHNEYGEIFEGALNRKLMVEKRLMKMAAAIKDVPKPELIGDENAEVTFVTWGSGKGICLEAVEILKEEGVLANVLQIKTAWPFDAAAIKEILEDCNRPILVEENFTGQMGGLIAEHTGILIEDKILRYDGRPMTAKDVAFAAIKN